MSELTKNKVRDILLRHKLSQTPIRASILTILIENHGPFSAEEISNRIENEEFDPATLFRNLKKLTDLNILRATRIDEDFSRYELNTGHHHHHFRCTSCGNIESIDDCVVKDFISSLESKGYSEIKHHLEFTGRCPKCLK